MRIYGRDICIVVVQGVRRLCDEGINLTGGSRKVDTRSAKKEVQGSWMNGRTIATVTVG